MTSEQTKYNLFQYSCKENTDAIALNTLLWYHCGEMHTHFTTKEPAAQAPYFRFEHFTTIISRGNMNDKSIHILEFDTIRELLARKATSDPGRQLCRTLVPMTDMAEINRAQDETADALSRIFRNGSISFGSNRDITLLSKSLDAGSSLDASELLHVANLLDNTARVKAYGRTGLNSDDAAASADSISTYFDALEPLSNITAEIRRCILAEDEIADDASQTLRSIRRSKALTGERIHSQLNAMISGPLRTYLQDGVITMRDDRYCIPVKAENKSQVPGMVHDQSSTGSTFFIEPAAIVSLNNQLRELTLQEKNEIAVILATLSGEVAFHTEELMRNFRMMTQLDFIFARASLAADENATRPLFNEKHVINLRKARHPLIDPKKVVPVDISLGDEFDLLVITGPNTGGKTVSLKTIGLLTLMGQAGLHIPALDRSELSLFTEVFADIGDEQSIEQSLSTFSSHMTNIVYILDHADPDSLCLFDELGAGTDPTEGAALAVALLEHFHSSGIRTVATTHYSELKIYALSEPGVENACCEFDVESLRPTYRLLIGIPGKSNAFAISSRLGLPGYIINEAKKHITEDKESFEDTIAYLEKTRVSLEKKQREIEMREDTIKSREADIASKQEKLNASREKLLLDANEEARSILQEAKDVADQTIRTFNRAGSGSDIRELEHSRDNVRRKISERSSHISAATPKEQHPLLRSEQLHRGDMVRVVSMGLKGTVSSLPDKNGRLYVQCGIIRSLVQLDDLVLLPDEDITEKTGKNGSGSSRIAMSKSLSVPTEINLLGMTTDQAVDELDKYLDDASIAHLPEVRIVHGKGTGALRSAVHNYLKKSPYIRSFRLGEFGEGDAGVTIAKL
jgi:DNA mismatch repair protein MutS2